MSEFLAMGGYAAFVWPAFFISFVVLIAITMLSVRAYRKENAALRAMEASIDLNDADGR